MESKYENDLTGYETLKINSEYLVNVHKGTIIKKKTKLKVGTKNVYFYQKKLVLARIIWEQVNGDIPDGFVIEYVNGDQTNRSISNLKIVSLIKNQSAQKIQCKCGSYYLNKATIRYSHKKTRKHQEYLQESSLETETDLDDDDEVEMSDCE